MRALLHAAGRDPPYEFSSQQDWANWFSLFGSPPMGTSSGLDFALVKYAPEQVHH